MIDEKRLINELRKYDFSFMQRKDVQDCIEAVINKQPKVGEWIPCSERLPEMHREDMESEGEYYMISDPVLATDGERIYVAEYEVDDDYKIGWSGCDGEEYEGIIVWMPLPEPYRGDEE